MKAWFRYERDFAQRWCPVVLYDDARPARKPFDDGRVTDMIEVPASCLASDGSPMFGRLQAIYPPPRNADDDAG